MGNTIFGQITNYIETGIPIIFVEDGIYYNQYLINQIYKANLKDSIYIFDSITTNHYKVSYDQNEEMLNLNQIASTLWNYEVGNNLVVIKGFEKELAQDELNSSQIFSSLAYNITNSEYKNLTIMFIGDKYDIPNNLKKYSMVITKQLPNKKEIKEVIKSFFNYQFEGLNIEFEPPNYLVNAMIGLNEIEIEQTLSTIFYENGMATLDSSNYEAKVNILNEIKNMKSQLIKKTGNLSIVETLNTFNDIGGLNSLKKYINSTYKKYERAEELQEKNINLPKGVLILGKPGNGKSLIAKATANKLKMPLIKFDISKILGKYVGESEKQMQKALQIIQAMSPCVLWIDEIEKTFAGINNENNDTMRKILGLFLTWMSDENKSVFVVATANAIDNNIPPELVRKGRFEEIFYVDNPSKEDRKLIFKLHFNKRGINLSNSILNTVGEKSEFLSGAEIEYISNQIASTYYINDSRKISNDELESMIIELIKEVLKSKNIVDLTNDINSQFESIKQQNEDLIDTLESIKDSENSTDIIFADEIKKFISNEIYQTIKKTKSDKANREKYKKA